MREVRNPYRTAGDAVLIVQTTRYGQYGSMTRAHEALGGRWSTVICKSMRAMSALGHKRTYAAQHVMSALPPIATAKADIRKRSCLLYPQKRTCAVQETMSAMGQ